MARAERRSPPVGLQPRRVADRHFDRGDAPRARRARLPGIHCEHAYPQRGRIGGDRPSHGASDGDQAQRQLRVGPAPVRRIRARSGQRLGRRRCRRPYHTRELSVESGKRVQVRRHRHPSGHDEGVVQRSWPHRRSQSERCVGGDRTGRCHGARARNSAQPARARHGEWSGHQDVRPESAVAGHRHEGLSMKSRALQQGGFLLEALVAILIFSFGVLGIVGLQASAMQFTNDAQYRSEAAYLANTLIAQMWADNRAQIAVKYGMPPGPGLGYTTMKAQIDADLPGAAALPAAAPSLEILFNEQAPVTPTSVNVRVVVRWKAPSDTQAHNYEATATIGQNL